MAVHYILNKGSMGPLLDLLDMHPKYIQLDSETTGLHFIDHDLKLIQIGIGDEQFVINVNRVGIPTLKSLLKPVLIDRKTTKILHNSLFDLCFFQEKLGIEVKGVYDTMLCERVLVANNGRSDLATTLWRRLKYELPKEAVMGFVGHEGDVFTDELIQYAAADVKFLERLMEVQKNIATPAELAIFRLENRVAEICAKMKVVGICHDTVKWLELADESETIYNEALERQNQYAQINWGSEKQVKQYFIDEHEVFIDSYKNLPKIAKKYPKLAPLQEFIDLRSKYQNVKLYGKNWMTIKLNNRAPIQKTTTIHRGRVHPNFNQIIATGRFSCTQPNLQQIPREGPYRECFYASDGYTFVIADYSGQELGIAAVMSGEKRWLEILEGGGDIHGDMAAQIFGPEYTKEQRFIAKRANFAILYGGGADTVAWSADIGRNDARYVIQQWRKTVPTLYQWLRQTARSGEVNGEVFSKLGRRRDVSNEKWRKWTTSMNHPVQGTGADIIKLAMFYIDREIEEKGLPVRIALPIHDELITECELGYEQEWLPTFQHLMEKASRDILGYDVVPAEPFISPKWIK